MKSGLAVVLVVLLATACSSGRETGTNVDASGLCTDDDQCPAGQTCQGGLCKPPVDAGEPADARLDPPEIVVSPLTLDFGNALLGVDTTLPVEITNAGQADLHVTSVTIFESDSRPEYTAMTSMPTPFVVAAGTSEIVDVTLRPLDAEIDVGELRIASDDLDEPQVVVNLISDLKGTPDVDATPPTIDYGVVSYGTTVTRDVDVVNAGSGNAPLVIDAVTITNVSGDGTLYSAELFDVMTDGTEVPTTLPIYLSAGDATTPADLLRIRVAFLATTSTSGPAPDEDLVLGTNDPDPAEAQLHIPISGTVFGCMTPLPEICDGLDNDCDLMADEGDPGSGGTCTTGMPGICSAGIQHCIGGALQCTPNLTPQPEVCDGLDNDCDSSVDDGLVQTCYNDCGMTGVEFCVAGSWVGCTAPPEPSEVCDTLDNDCDGSVDEGFDLSSDINNCGSCGNACSAAHAIEGCASGMCQILFCDAGYVDVNGTFGDGCECADDTTEATAGSGDSCPSTLTMGTLAEGGSMTITGKIATVGDQDWYQVGFTDAADPGGGVCDPYRPNIVFSSNPGSAYRFVVYNVDCSAYSTCSGANLTDFKYYSGAGANDCCQSGNLPGWNTCTSQTMTLRIGVVRSSGASCSSYSLLVKNGP